MRKMQAILVIASAVMCGNLAVAADRDFSMAEYYIGRDLRETIPSGTYAGLPNPNYNRLTWLYAHTYASTPNSNHYHAKSVYTYSGPAASPDVVVSTGNFMPEDGSRIQLLPGSGVFAGKWISGLNSNLDFHDLTIKPVDTLAGFASGSGQDILYRSGGTTPVGRWTGSLAGADISLVLTAITPGLSIVDGSGNPLAVNVGDSISLGAGSLVDFTPIFLTETGTQANYSATFKLVDGGTGNNGGPWLESGAMSYNVVVPEPGVMGLLVPMAGMLGLRRRETGHW